MWVFLVFAAVRQNSPLRRRVFGSLRVVAYFATMLVVGAVLTVRRARGDVRERVDALAHELLPLSDLLDGVTALRINGELLRVSMDTVPDVSVPEALDRVERVCHANPGPLAKLLNQMAAELPAGVSEAEPLRKLFTRAAVLRTNDEAAGGVLCFTDAKRPTNPDFMEAFARTRDLGELGNLRYVMASRGEKGQGEDNLTRVFAFWTEGQFRLTSLEPPLHGDAPGSDSSLLPRPPRSTRIFSAEAVGAPYSVRIYETNDAKERVLAFYDEAMKDWSAPFEYTAKDPERAYYKTGKPVLITVDTDASKTLVTLSEVGAR